MISDLPVFIEMSRPRSAEERVRDVLQSYSARAMSPQKALELEAALEEITNEPWVVVCLEDEPLRQVQAITKANWEAMAFETRADYVRLCDHPVFEAIHGAGFHIQEWAYKQALRHEPALALAMRDAYLAKAANVARYEREKRERNR